jgi:hypothetical protein
MEQAVLVSVLAEEYERCGLAADRLPYTDKFEEMYENVITRTGSAIDRAEMWRLLANARKRGALPRLST